MKRYKWGYFFAASALCAYFLTSFGAPPLAVLAGILGAASFMRRSPKPAQGKV